MGYLEKKAPKFVDVINKLKSAIKLENNGQPITNSKDEKVREELEHTAKKKQNIIIFILLCSRLLLLAL